MKYNQAHHTNKERRAWNRASVPPGLSAKQAPRAREKKIRNKREINSSEGE
jgi:hypothetical protein